MAASSNLPNQTPISTILLLLLIFLIYLPITIRSASNLPFSNTTPHQTLSHETLTKLHFYFHDIVTGPKPTSVIIARSQNATTVGFGDLVMIDDPLTVGPDPKSRTIGRAQGMYGESSQSESSLIMAVTFVFFEGNYNGSSVSILGRYPVSNAVREMPIVGGSGVFRMARGYVQANTVKYDVKTGDATSEYHVFVLHSESLAGF